MPSYRSAKLRMNRRLLIGSLAVLGTVGLVAGGIQVVPYISSTPTAASSSATVPTLDVGSANAPLLDTTLPHSLSLDLDQAALDEMLSDYETDGSKAWARATLTIDSVSIGDVGVRLKGNSTLRALGGEQSGPGGGMGGMMTSIDIDDPTSYPLLISFDKYVEGRVYQGMSELSLRPGTPSANEAAALSLTATTGQPTQGYSYVTYSLNESADTTRLLVVNPDENYAAELGNGILYKADATSSFTYQGEDQTDYDGQFNQINGHGSVDLQPIITFLRWLDSATDEEFDAELGGYVDVESFARYLATQNLLVNMDDMSGPGQNYYLWYDLDTGLLSVVSWDLNMAMTGSTDAGPHDDISMGGGGGMPPPEGMTMPEGFRDQPFPDGAGGPDGFAMGGNELKERFLASDTFTGVYEQSYWELCEQIYGSGAATEVVDKLAETIPVTAGLDQATLDTSLAQLRDWVTQRAQALAALRGESAV